MSKNFETCHSCGRNYFPEEEKQHKINCSAMKYNNKNLKEDDNTERKKVRWEQKWIVYPNVFEFSKAISTLY